MKLKELAEVLTNRKTYLFRDKSNRFLMSASIPYIRISSLRNCEVLDIDGTEIVLDVIWNSDEERFEGLEKEY